MSDCSCIYTCMYNVYNYMSLLYCPTVPFIKFSYTGSPYIYVLLTSRSIGTYVVIKPEGERFITANVPSTDVMQVICVTGAARC